MGRDARNAKRTAENYYAANPVQKCIVCGRMFIRRKDNVCSIACAERAQKLDLPLCSGNRSRQWRH
jgi:hypothetical protein